MVYYFGMGYFVFARFALIAYAIHLHFIYTIFFPLINGNTFSCIINSCYTVTHKYVHTKIPILIR